MKKVLFVITYPIRLLCIGLVYLYQWTISPLLPKTCRYVPTCSRYMIMAIKEWGLYGIVLGVKRLSRCRTHHPHSGEDFVPINPKGEKQWIF